MGKLVSCIVFVTALGAYACANDPEYVRCGASDMMDTCLLDTANAMGSGDDVFVMGSLHVPTRPLTMDLLKVQSDLQATMPAGVMYRIDQYDVSVEYTVKNLDSMPGQVKIELNGANELYAWTPSMIMQPANSEEPPPPGLAGDIPIDIQGNGELDGVFREDQLLEAAIDLDQITRGNVNEYAATLTVNKNDLSFQPMSPLMPPPPGSNEPPPQMPLGPAIPRAAFANFVRVDMVLRASTHMTMEFSLRVRPHVNDVIHDHGMDAPAAELTILDPAAFIPAYAP